jgi:hypothetical protein
VEEEFKAIPDWLKWLMTFINRIGFPILVSIMFFYLYVVSLKQVRDNMDTNTTHLVTAIQENTAAMQAVKRILLKRYE